MADSQTSYNRSAKNLGKNQRRLIYLLFSFFAPLLFSTPILYLVRLQHDSKFMHGSFENAKAIKGALAFVRRTYGNVEKYRFLNSMDGWNYLRGNIETRRLGCREYPNGGESCVFSGIACVDLNMEPKLRSKDGSRHLVYLVDETRPDRETVSSDSYCQKSHVSADPKYYGAKEWPPRDEYVAPRHSCLDAQWRTKNSLFGNRMNPPKIRWLEDVSLIDLDFLNFYHNIKYLTSTSWMLDVALWQKLMSQVDNYPTLFTPPKHILFPQRLSDFIEQTNDVNRLNLALVLGLDARELYRGQKPREDGIRDAKPFMDAFPEAKERFIFLADKQNKEGNQLVCTKKLTVGAKLHNLGNERVCNHLRRKTWELFNITGPPLVPASGFLVYHRPPRRVVLLQRLVNRGFRNVDDLGTALRTAAAEYNFEFEIYSPVSTDPVEEEVRMYANTGVLLTTYHSTGGIWMPRHSAVIEVHPPGYTDFLFHITAKTCNLWYFEIQGVIPDEYRERYQRACGSKLDTPFDHCNSMKNYFVEAPVQKAVQAVIKALNRLGHDMTTKNTE